jgi:RNA polymerase sigma-70 factor (ECF subfamily)
MGVSADPSIRVDALYRAYRQDVYRSLLRDLGSPADADDGTQAVFLNAFRALDRGCKPHAARAWLLAIAKNVARKTWRERARRDHDLEPDEIPAAEPGDESRRELVAVLETLPTGQRAALMLHELCGLEYGEISQRTGQSVAGVETSVFRARQAVRTAMRGNGALDHDVAAKLLKRLVAGKLTRGEREGVQAHLEGCPDCASVETRLRSTRSRTRLLSWLLSAPGAAQRLLALLQASPARGLGAVAVCALGLAGLAGDRPGQPDARPFSPDPEPVRAARVPVPGTGVGVGATSVSAVRIVPRTRAVVGAEPARTRAKPTRTKLVARRPGADAAPLPRGSERDTQPGAGRSSAAAPAPATGAPSPYVGRAAVEPPVLPKPAALPPVTVPDVGHQVVDDMLGLVDGPLPGDLDSAGAAVTGTATDVANDVGVVARSVTDDARRVAGATDLSDPVDALPTVAAVPPLPLPG